MKTTSQASKASKTEETAKLFENISGNAKNADSQINGENAPSTIQDIPLPVCEVKKEPVETKEADGPSQVLAWVSDISKEFTLKLATTDIKELETMISLYLTKISSCISKCYVPNRAAKMKRCMNDVLLFFNFIYQEIPEDKKTYSTYLDTMTELMAYYIDMEIQASSRAKENPMVIAGKLTSSLYIFLDKSHDHILDSILKANNLNRNFWELCSLIFGGVLKETPNKIMGELTYVRYILVYKMWKRVVQGPEERKKVMNLASIRLKHPPQFAEKIRAGLLNGIIPKIPKKRPDVTTFLIQAKFDVKEKAEAFLKYISESKTSIMFVPTVPAIKTDIPLLVGKLPDFGPSPNLVKIEPPDLEDNDSYPKKVDISGSRLLNDLWTSVNHEASFREALRMQSVTTFCRTEFKIKEKKKLHRVLKQRKGRLKAPASSKSLHLSGYSVDKRVPDLLDKPRSKSSYAPTIILSDDSDKGFSDTGGEDGDEELKEMEKETPICTQPQPVGKKEPSPPPMDLLPSPELPKTPEQPKSPLPLQRFILTPSQIKREKEIENVIVEDSSENRKAEEPEISKVTVEQEIATDKDNTDEIDKIDNVETMELEVSISVKNAEIRQSTPSFVVTEEPVSKLFAKEQMIPTKKPCELKEEITTGSPTRENEVSIRINRDLFDKIRSPSVSEKEPVSGDTSVNPTETQEHESQEKPACDGDTNRDEPVASSPDKKTENVLFDDEENSWSPSGGNQEFFRTVVDNFISTYLPADDVETTQLASNSVHEPVATSEISSEVIPVQNKEVLETVIDNTPAPVLCVSNLSSEAAAEDRNIPSVEEDACLPAAKRCRMEDDSRSEEKTPSPTDEELMEEPSESACVPDTYAEDPPKPSGKSDTKIVDDPARLHTITLTKDHTIFLEQSQLRTMLGKAPKECPPIPSPDQIDPDTAKPIVRCHCPQCEGNYSALLYNYAALVGFQNDVYEKNMMESDSFENHGSPTNELSDQFESRLEDDNADQGDEGNGSASDSSIQLPFKKRKAFSSSDGDRRDDGESQHSDASKDDLPQADYPSQPMLSIADLADPWAAQAFEGTSAQVPPASDNCSYPAEPPNTMHSSVLQTGIVQTTKYATSSSGGSCFTSDSIPVGGHSAVAAQLPRRGFPFSATSSSDAFPQASLSENFSYKTKPQAQTAPSPPRTRGMETRYSSSLAASFSTSSTPSGMHSSKPPGGGFPPFSAVIPPLTSFSDALNQHNKTSAHSIESMVSRNYEAVSSADRIPRCITSNERAGNGSERKYRTFVTPAQLKQAVMGPSSYSREDSSHYLNDSNSIRKNINSPSRSNRSKREQNTSSRKSGRSYRKKKI